jgi:beta-N-acetylhexosaminidase
MTDSLVMGALHGIAADGELTVLAFEAGNDLLLMPPSLPEAVAAMREAVTSGRVPLSRLDSSVRRILNLKLRLGLIPPPMIDVNAATGALALPEHTAIRNAVATACRC